MIVQMHIYQMLPLKDVKASLSEHLSGGQEFLLMTIIDFVSVFTVLLYSVFLYRYNMFLNANLFY